LARRAAFNRAQGHRFGVKVGSVSDVTIDPKTYLAVMHLSLSRM
jgi:sporulation protein YlmC with PRC-barrel domain